MPGLLMSEIRYIPFLSTNTPESCLEEVTGLDSEAYPSGEPFLFCTSLGDVWTPDNLLDNLFSLRYRGKVFVTYNLGYESGALLRHLSLASLTELAAEGVLDCDGYRYVCFARKFLSISKDHKTCRFYDLFPFFGSSLEHAAKVFLGDHKIEMDTHSFTPELVLRDWDKIVGYCTHDAELTARLGMYLLNKAHDLGIYPKALYSPASLSSAYFSPYASKCMVRRYVYQNPELIQMAYDSYRGGKFEMTKRGSFRGYRYDMVSAYPSVIRDLRALDKGRVVHEAAYIPEACYAYYSVTCRIPDGLFHPVGLADGGVAVYPEGTIIATVNKPELDFLRTHQVDVTITDAWHLMIKSRSYPYRHVVDDLLELKVLYKDTDPWLYRLVKLTINSYYGKLVQMIEQPNGKWRAGGLWNPIHASEITARVRCQMSELQNRYAASAIAVHTDSIITKREISPEYLGEKAGKFRLEGKGAAIMVLVGAYSLAGEEHTRGFKAPEGWSWKSALEKYREATSITLRATEARSWVEAVRLQDVTRINRFVETQKTIRLNEDRKRLWLKEATAQDLLGPLESSVARYGFDLRGRGKKRFII